FSLDAAVSTFSGITHTYVTSPGSGLPDTISVTITGADGQSGTASTSVVVTDYVPMVTAPAGVPGPNEGATTAYDLGTFSDADPSNTAWSVDVNGGDGSADTSFTTTSQGALGSHSHVFGDSGTYTVTVTVSDDDGDAGSATFQVVVADVPPTVAADAA